jgi:hypothetical protein
VHYPIIKMFTPVDKLMTTLSSHFFEVKEGENDRVLWPALALHDHLGQLQDGRHPGPVVVVAVGRVHRVPVGAENHLEKVRRLVFKSNSRIYIGKGKEILLKGKAQYG